MDFAELNLMIPKPSQGLLRLFKFNCKVAGIVVYAQMLIETGIAGMLFAQAVEKLSRFNAVFEKAKRLWLKAKVKPAPRPLAELRDMLDAAPYVVANGALLFLCADKLLKRTGQGADAALDPGGY